MFKKRTANAKIVNLNTEINEIQCIPQQLQEQIRNKQIQQLINQQAYQNQFSQLKENTNKMYFSSKNANINKSKEQQQNNQNQQSQIKVKQVSLDNKMSQKQHTVAYIHLNIKNTSLSFQNTQNNNFKFNVTSPLHQIKNSNVYIKQQDQNIQKQEMLQFLQSLKQQKNYFLNQLEYQRPIQLQSNVVLIDDQIQNVDNNKQSYNQQQYDNQLIVEQDLEGGISPVMSQEENIYAQQDYEDVLIRKTLTRQNYKKISEVNGLKQSKQKSKTQKLIKMITGISQTHIQNNLNHQILKKTQNMEQLKRQIKYLQERTNEKDGQIQVKRKTTNQLKKQYQKIMKIIYFICYKGQTIQEFEMKPLVQLSQDFDIQNYGKKGNKKVKLNQPQQDYNEAGQDQDQDQQNGLDVIMEEDQY